MELLKALEDMERNIPPVALCIYITSDGRLQDFRSHAHWVLNHANIHYPSFGRREKNRRTDNADITVRQPGEEREPEPQPPAEPSRWQRMRSWVRDALHPYPPPVQRKWMLILVLDVQLEVACFSWGYMLDPYINPDSINSCILGARLQFRERAMVTGLKKVMKSAVNQIAAQSHRVNRRLRHMGPLQIMLAAGALGIAGAAYPAAAQQPLPAGSPPVTWTGEDVAEDDEDDAAPATPAQAAEPSASTPSAAADATSGAAATDTAAPRWSEADYRHLLGGELDGAYSMLLAPQHAPRLVQPQKNPAQHTRQAPESDTKVPKQYYPAYAQNPLTGVLDPQGLLANAQREDVEYVLRAINAHSPYRLYLAVFKQGQDLPPDLAVGSLVRSVARPDEYAAMLMYGLGDTPWVEVGLYEMAADDDTRQAWMDSVGAAALAAGGGVEGLLAAARELHRCVEPKAAKLPPIARKNAEDVPFIPIDFVNTKKEKERSFKDKIVAFIEDPDMLPVFVWSGCVLGVLLLVCGGIWLRRRSGQLLETPADIRLASPHGAGVSRNVRYLEGKRQ